MKRWQQMTQEEQKKYVPNLERDIERLQKKLDIATKALKEYGRCENGSYANKALALIKEEV